MRQTVIGWTFAGFCVLANLPKPERQEWEQLWTDVEALRRKCAQP